MNDRIAQLKVYDWGGDRGILAGIDQQIVDAHGDDDALEAIEQGLLEVLQTDAPAPAKEYACRQLALIGTARSVPILAEMLVHTELADCARFALEAIPDAAAARALRRALDTVEGDARVGIVNSLGERRDQKSFRVLSKMQDNADTALSAAIQAALRKIESKGSLKAAERAPRGGR